MRILVTGSTGFVGRWLTIELRDHGHEVVEAGGHATVDVSDPAAVRRLVDERRPEAIAHLAGIAFGPDARRDPERAVEINAGGTRNVVAAAAEAGRPVPVLAVSSAEVYGTPDPDDLPLVEESALLATQPYGRSKLAAEAAASEVAEAGAVPLAIVRPFNHTGPGQRLDFVVPALAARIHAARERGSRSIVAGNVDVRRDIGDVRDVVRAYRLLLEWLPDRGAGAPVVVNVATGRSIAIREVIGRLAGLAGVDIAVDVDPALVRADDPPEIRGDSTRLTELTGWRPTFSIDETLASVDADVRARLAATK